MRFKYPPDHALPNSRLQTLKRPLDNQPARYPNAAGQGARRTEAASAIGYHFPRYIDTSWISQTRLQPDSLRNAAFPGTTRKGISAAKHET